MRTTNFSLGPRAARSECQLLGITAYTPLQYLRVAPKAIKVMRAAKRSPGYMGHKTWVKPPLVVYALSFWESEEALMEFAKLPVHREIQRWAAKGNVKASSFRVTRSDESGYTTGVWRAEAGRAAAHTSPKVDLDAFASTVLENLDGGGRHVIDPTAPATVVVIGNRSNAGMAEGYIAEHLVSEIWRVPVVQVATAKGTPGFAKRIARRDIRRGAERHRAQLESLVPHPELDPNSYLSYLVDWTGQVTDRVGYAHESENLALLLVGRDGRILCSGGSDNIQLFIELAAKALACTTAQPNLNARVESMDSAGVGRARSVTCSRGIIPGNCGASSGIFEGIELEAPDGGPFDRDWLGSAQTVLVFGNRSNAAEVAKFSRDLLFDNPTSKVIEIVCATNVPRFALPKLRSDLARGLEGQRKALGPQAHSLRVAVDSVGALCRVFGFGPRSEDIHVVGFGPGGELVEGAGSVGARHVAAFFASSSLGSMELAS